jgi:hypothetical protein
MDYPPRMSFSGEIYLKSPFAPGSFVCLDPIMDRPHRGSFTFGREYLVGAVGQAPKSYYGDLIQIADDNGLVVWVVWEHFEAIRAVAL